MYLENVTVVCFLASYIVALVLEAALFLGRMRVLRWSALGFTTAGLIAQTAYLVNRSWQVDLPPLLGSSHDWLLVSAWLVVVLYLGIQFWNRDLSLGIFCLPLVVLLVVASWFASTSPTPQALDASLYVWSMWHASFLVFGMLGILLSQIVSLMYLIQHSRLKHKRAELPALHLLSLERLARLNWWLVVLSVPLLTFGMLSGLWMTYLTQQGMENPVTLGNVAFVANALVWAAMAMLFGWLLVAKHPTGRVVAWRTVLATGFLLVMLLALKLTSADGIHGGPG